MKYWISIILFVILFGWFAHSASDHNQITADYKGCDKHGGINFISYAGKTNYYMVRCEDETVKLVTFDEADALN